MKRCLQFGCGWSAPSGWHNFDSSPTLRFERVPVLGKLYTKNSSRFPDNVSYGDVVKGLPVAKESFDLIYCSHVLEHLALEDLRRALKNTFDLLKNRGVFRIVVPDLEFYAREYLTDSSKPAASNFMRATSLGHERRRRGVRGIASAFLGNSLHLWMWDYKALEDELEKAGFSEIRRASYNDSTFEEFRDVESAERWESALGIECKAIKA